MSKSFSISLFNSTRGKISHYTGLLLFSFSSTRANQRKFMLIITYLARLELNRGTFIEEALSVFSSNRAKIGVLSRLSIKMIQYSRVTTKRIRV